MFTILKYDAFQPSVRGFFHPPYTILGSRGVAHGYLNPTKAELLSGKLYPRLKVTKRAARGGFQIVMRIEFSVPKLLYNNNFDEVTNEQFDEVIDTLKSRLKEKGVLLSRSMLVNALLSKVDYSKNIILEPHSSSRLIINELSKADVKLWLDLETVKYRNAGYGVKYRNNGFELACYDKNKDLLKGKNSDKKSEENDNAIQLDLLEKLTKRDAIQVFRIEARLNSRLKIRQTFKAVGIDAEPTLKDAFNCNYAQKILQHYWKYLEDGYKGLEHNPSSPSKLFADLAGYNPDKRLSVLLKAVGIKVLTHELGVRGITIEMYDKKYKEYREKQEQIRSKLSNLENADETYYQTVTSLLQLANKAPELFKRSEMQQKRELLQLTLQNLVLNGDKLEFNLLKPFDLLLDLSKNGLWLRGRDSNPRPID